MALCSLSTGMIVAPPSRAFSMSGPAGDERLLVREGERRLAGAQGRRAKVRVPHSPYRRKHDIDVVRLRQVHEPFGPLEELRGWIRGPQAFEGRLVGQRGARGLEFVDLRLERLPIGLGPQPDDAASIRKLARHVERALSD
jgi:hypothetical protein